MRSARRIGAAGAAALILATLAAAPASRGEDYALLVGASQYEKVAGLKDLRFSRDDVIEFAEVLKRAGYRPRNIVLMHDKLTDSALRPSCASIVNQLDLLLSRLREDDTIIVALAGHGVQYQGQKLHYFCPIDTDLERAESMIPLTELYAKLDGCAASRKLLLVDACRNDPQANASRELARFKLESVTRPQSEPVPRSITALFSCREGEQSFEDDELRHGVFFAQVLRAWEGLADGDADNGLAGDGDVTLEELIRFVERQTEEHAAARLGKKQHPQRKNEGDSGWVLRTLKRARGGAGSGDPTLTEARRLLREEKFERSREAYSRAIAANPASAPAHHGRGLAALALGDVDAALADFRKALELAPDDAQAQISLGGALGRTGRTNEAIQAYTRAIQLDRNAAKAYIGRGAARFELGQFNEALADLNQALRLKSNHPDALFLRSRVHARRGDSAAAQADLQRLRSVEAGGPPSRPMP